MKGKNLNLNKNINRKEMKKKVKKFKWSEKKIQPRKNGREKLEAEKN